MSALDDYDETAVNDDALAEAWARADEDVQYEVIPPGTYEIEVVKAENKMKKDGTASYVNIQLQVVEGDFEGRTLWCVFPIRHPEERARGLAQFKFRKFATA